MPTISQQKRRDNLEKEVRIAFLQKKNLWDNFNLQTRCAEEKLKVYKQWLIDNSLESLIDLDQYK